jgi:hypothetical protein
MITDLAITNEYTQDPRQLERNKDLNLMSTHFIVNYFLCLSALTPNYFVSLNSK